MGVRSQDGVRQGLNRETWEQLHKYAKQKGVGISELIESILEDKIDAYEPSGIKKVTYKTLAIHKSVHKKIQNLCNKKGLKKADVIREILENEILLRDTAELVRLFPKLKV